MHFAGVKAVDKDPKAYVEAALAVRRRSTKMLVTRRNVFAETRALAQAREPAFHARHRRALQLEVEESLKRYAERNVADGEIGAGEVVRTLELRLHQLERTDHILARRFHCFRPTLILRQPFQMHDERVDGGSNR